ncbi:MAG: SprT-like domain-containing protein [Campylobacterota bacterium]|nr:SprT-like domain-containing protein [Campylobacterota bacterium]
MTILTIRNIFIYLTVSSALLLGIIVYNDHHFKTNPLSKEIMEKIDNKNRYIVSLIKRRYNIDFNVPILISDKMPDNLFGLAAYTKDGKIKIVLNKNRFQESVEYMVDYVLPHEYAHALMFKIGDFTKQNGGHTKKWQQICLSLEGKKCDRFVDHKDIIFGKVPY